MRRISLAVLIVFCLPGCKTNPATGQRQLMLMSEADEIQLGRESDVEVQKQMGIYHDPALQQYVEGIGMRLAKASHRPALPWKFSVVDSSAVNAFALPGGFIYVTRGLLPFLRDEAELAAVLGHEVGHVDARHSAAAYSKQLLTGVSLAGLGIFVPSTRPLQGAFGVAFGLMFLKNSRSNELEADKLGVGYTSTSGWSPDAMLGVLGTLGRLDQAGSSSRGVPSWALTHPPAEDRVARVEEAVAAARGRFAADTNRAAFEPRLDGLVFGDSREQGIVRGADFLHPILRLAVRFPTSWEIVNSADQVAAREKDGGSVAIVLEVVDKPSGSPEQTARDVMTKAGLTESGGQRLDINGLPAYWGRYDGTLNNTAVTLRAAHIQIDRQVYLLAGVATPSDFNRVDQTFVTTIRSFRALSRAEADRIQPNRVDFAVVQGGETWTSLARTASHGNVSAATLAIMNGETPATAPRAGTRIRIVITGG